MGRLLSNRIIFFLFTVSGWLVHAQGSFAATTVGQCHQELEAQFVGQVNSEQIKDALSKYLEVPLSRALEECRQKEAVPKISNFWGRDVVTISTHECPILHDKVDRAYHLVMSLPAGRRWLAQVILGEELPHHERSAELTYCSQIPAMINWNSVSAQIQNLWGVSEEVARQSIPEIVRSTRPQSKVLMQTYFGNERSGYQAVSSKNYFFALGSNSVQMDSFTLSNNQTWVWINDGADPDLSLIQTIAHEIAITGDEKANLFRWLNAVARPQEVESWKTAVRDVFFNQVMAILRAYRLEAKIVADLREADPVRFKKNRLLESFANLDASTCHDFYLRLARAHFLTIYGAKFQDQARLTRLLSKGAEIKTRTGDSVDACLFFSEPSGTFYGPGNGGPRPREGGW